ncbi:hypothetical protein CLIB1444_01S11144 [[Candida] jaroonii]|uniref:Uncharacterized protein n=1 Tax=[Candida] jaroonii TaxID=467808 RepID=A0ACA9Y109_9ASCO|nr:hypothetical protein CLIB1444_01S11144 [[Candida] jaroonii]
MNEQDKQDPKFDPENLMINIGGRSVPFKSINKPHTVVTRHIPREGVMNAGDHHEISKKDVPEPEDQATLKAKTEELNK